jgi:hypothetical protein
VGWYSVIKTIKGHRYEYLQRTWREGKKVHTESRYIGPAAPESAGRPGGTAQVEPITTTPRIFYHGARERLSGALQPSESGTFGPGFYLTTQERAELYAWYGAGIAAKIGASEEGWRGEPTYDGVVYAFDVGELRIKELTWDRYLDECEALDPSRAATPLAKAKVQEALIAEGYDGLYIPDDLRHELVIFPSSINKIKVHKS